jgi:hypothetical protein
MAAISSIFSNPAAMTASDIDVGRRLRKRHWNKTPSASLSGRRACIPHVLQQLRWAVVAEAGVVQ